MLKKGLVALTIISALWVSVFSRPAYSDDENALTAAKPQAGLVDLEGAHHEDRIRDLERRIDDLDRERRSQDERIRSIERTVNDLRRGR